MSPAIHNRIQTKSPGKEPEARTCILKVLTYFDIFHYPLTREEISLFLEAPIPGTGIDLILDQMKADKTIYLFQGYYSLHNNPLMARRRKEGNQRAAQLLPVALRIGKFLYQFPFVKAIGISGSLSKNFADEKADIDFFIITKTNRLWIARTLMHLFKKLTFLTGRQHYYCMNYYIDEAALKLPEENIFTAIEIKTLLPVSGNPSMQEFFAANQWANEWIPSCCFRPQQGRDPRRSLVKRMFEWFLTNPLADRLDNFLLRVTNRRWKRKEARGKRNEKGQMMGLITGKHFARSNPGAFQEKVLAIYEQKLKALKADPSLILS